MLKCVTRSPLPLHVGPHPDSFQVVIMLGHIVSQDPEYKNKPLFKESRQRRPGPAARPRAAPCEKPRTRSWSPILSLSIWISCSGLLSRALVMALWAVIRVAVFKSFTAITESTGSQMRNWTSAPTDNTAPSLEANCFRRS